MRSIWCACFAATPSASCQSLCFKCKYSPKPVLNALWWRDASRGRSSSKPYQYLLS
ncbi:hypothetical protein PR003_g16720 [Phytophthora rubi]|uniref:Uncharacterized protein n=1 Tax=Phytophthora rubi TaxID=129364 RepID=A0A6A4ELI9_9STRA|nr:hypothetical protein PR001_g17209 [Phytophthora rubi]KAE9324480.1 hypothetical protein PR003_g16720 [Phytophthora rubi]